MDTRGEIREFLTSRRARIRPEQAGLRTYGNGPRRVPGLRREEAALLAGVSIAYYTKLERGDQSSVLPRRRESPAETVSFSARRGVSPRAPSSFLGAVARRSGPRRAGETYEGRSPSGVFHAYAFIGAQGR